MIVLCSRLKAFQNSFSDLRLLHPIVHGNGAIKLIAGLADNLDGLEPGPAERLYRHLFHQLPALKKRYRAKSCLTRKVFDALCQTAHQFSG